MKNMKILYILPYNWGGMPHYTAELANAVSKYAHVTIIGSKMIKDDLFTKNIKIIKIFNDLNFSINNMEKLFHPQNILSLMSFRKINIINKINPDLIHISTPPIPPLPIFISHYGLDKKYPMVYTKHGIFSDSGTFRIRLLEELTINLFERLIKFDKIIVHTQNDKNILYKIRKFHNKDMVVTVPHGVYSFFKRYDSDVSTEKNCILFFGNIRPYKGLKYLVEAIPIILKEIPDIKVIIAGEGDISQYSYIINNTYIFEIYNEFIPDYMVSKLFQRADIVVLPYSQMSGQSGIINIAYAYGKPVVASNVGGICEILDNGINGYLVNPKDKDALALAIIKILKDVKLKKQMIIATHKKARYLSWDNIAKMHIDIYEKVINDIIRIKK